MDCDEKRPSTVPGNRETALDDDVAAARPSTGPGHASRRRRCALGAGRHHSKQAGATQKKEGAPEHIRVGSTTPAPPGATEWNLAKGWPPLLGWQPSPRRIPLSAREPSAHEGRKSIEDEVGLDIDRPLVSRQGLAWSPSSEDLSARPFTMRPGSQASRWNSLQDSRCKIAEGGSSVGQETAGMDQTTRANLQRLQRQRTNAQNGLALRDLDAGIEEIDRSLVDCWERHRVGFDGLLEVQEAEAAVNSECKRKEEGRSASKHRRRDGNDAVARAQALKEFQGGVIKRAADALEFNFVENVHDVPEVQKISSCVDRVGTKLEYYRDHDEKRDPLVDKIEKTFMAMVGQDQQPVVSLARLRGAFRQGGLVEKSDSDDDESMSPCRIRLVMPQKVPATLRLSRLHQAQSKARSLELDCRVDHLMTLSHRMSRREEAERARPWITHVVTVLMTVVFKSIKDVYHGAVEVATRVGSNNNQPVSCLALGAARHFKRNCQAKKLHRGRRAGIESPGSPGGRRTHPVLSDADITTINRRATRYVMMNDASRRKSNVWLQWRHLLRITRFLTILMRPVRRHRRMDLVKLFIEASWKGMQLRRGVKEYLYKVTMIQKHFHYAVKISKVLRQRVIGPQLWVSETLLIAAAVGFTPDKMLALKAITDAYLRTCEVERWRFKAASLIALRDNLFQMGPEHKKALAMGSRVLQKREARRVSINLRDRRDRGGFQSEDHHDPLIPPRPPTGADPQEVLDVFTDSLLAGTDDEGGGEFHQDPQAKDRTSSIFGLFRGHVAVPTAVRQDSKALPAARGQKLPPMKTGQLPVGRGQKSMKTRQLDDDSREGTESPRRQISGSSRRRSPTKQSMTKSVSKTKLLEESETKKMVAETKAAEQEAAITLGTGALSVIEDYRLRVEVHEMIAIRLQRARTNSWYQAYRIYKAHLPKLQRDWIAWVKVVLSMGLENQQVWPEQPTMQTAPAEMLKDNPAMLQAMLLKKLREGRLGTLIH